MTQLSKIKERYAHMFRKYRYRVRHYDSFLRWRTEKTDACIANLERHGIDWRDDRLCRLVGNAPAYIDAQMEALKAVSASSELHYLLLKGVAARAKIFESKKMGH